MPAYWKFTDRAGYYRVLVYLPFLGEPKGRKEAHLSVLSRGVERKDNWQAELGSAMMADPPFCAARTTQTAPAAP